MHNFKIASHYIECPILQLNFFRCHSTCTELKIEFPKIVTGEDIKKVYLMSIGKYHWQIYSDRCININYLRISQRINNRPSTIYSFDVWLINRIDTSNFPMVPNWMQQSDIIYAFSCSAALYIEHIVAMTTLSMKKTRKCVSFIDFSEGLTLSARKNRRYFWSLEKREITGCISSSVIYVLCYLFWATLKGMTIKFRS